MSKKRKVTSKSRPARPARPTTKATPSKRAGRKPQQGSLSVATNKQKSAPERIAALTTLPPAKGKGNGQLDSMLKILTDRTESLDVRLAALQALGAARFAAADFKSMQGRYIAALRSVVDDPNPELRQRALGILARERDGFAQKKLLDGLAQPKKALLPPEKALQLLGYDVHAEAYPVAREIVRNPPNETAKREALRLLAADAASAPTFENILRDKSEGSDLRQISAAALHALNPESLQSHAREILLDPAEKDDMRQASLTALRQFGGAKIAEDATLMERVNELSTKASAKVQNSARQFLRTHKR
jgi:hypothetical protein